MHTRTRQLLEEVKECGHLQGRETADAVRAACSMVGRAAAEAYNLLVSYQEMLEEETDPAIRSALGEYEQKFRVLDATARELRDKAQRFRQGLRELRELEERLGAPLRVDGKLPHRD